MKKCVLLLSISLLSPVAVSLAGEAQPYGLAPDGSSFVLYDDEVKGKIERKGKMTIGAEEEVFSGSKSICVEYDFKAKENGVTFVPPEPVSTSGFDYLEFAYHSGPKGTGNKRIEAFVNNRQASFKRAQQLALTDDGRWCVISLPLSILGNPSEIRSIDFGFSECVAPKDPAWKMYFDSIRLVKKPSTQKAFSKPPEKILINGDFEDGALGWSIHGYSCEWTDDPQFVKEGKGAMRVYGSFDFSKGKGKPLFAGIYGQDLLDEFVACGDGTYEVEAWVKIPGGKGSVSFIGEYKGWEPPEGAMGKGGKAGGGEFGSAIIRKNKEGQVATATNSEWMQMKFPFELKLSGKATHAWVGFKSSEEVSEFYLDGVSIRKVGETKPNPVPEAAAKTSEAEAKELLAKFESAYTVSAIGKKGADEGEFQFPHSLALDAQGALYVADTDNHRIQKMDASGKWISFGKKGKGDGELSYPRGVAASPSGDLFVTDNNNYRLLKRAADGAWSVLDTRPSFNDWPPVGVGKTMDFTAPRSHCPEEFYSLALSPSGDLFCVDSAFNRVSKRDASGTWSPVGSPDPHYAEKLDEQTEGNPDTPRYITWGLGLGKFDCPRAVAFDGEGNLYVADTLNHRIQKMSKDGKWSILGGRGIQGDGKWSIIGRPNPPAGLRYGTTAGEFNEPRAIAADKEGNVFVCDSKNDRIQVMNKEGKWFAFGKTGSGLGEFNCPSGIAVNEKGTIYVADTRNHRIVVMKKK